MLLVHTLLCQALLHVCPHVLTRSSLVCRAVTVRRTRSCSPTQPPAHVDPPPHTHTHEHTTHTCITHARSHWLSHALTHMCTVKHTRALTWAAHPLTCVLTPALTRTRTARLAQTRARLWRAGLPDQTGDSHRTEPCPLTTTEKGQGTRSAEGKRRTERCTAWFSPLWVLRRKTCI
jgi:hypothetical protein